MAVNNVRHCFLCNNVDSLKFITVVIIYNKDIYYRPATGGEKKTAQDMAEADVSAKLGMLSAKLSWVVEYPKNFNPNPVQVLRHTIFTINIAPAKKEYQGNIFSYFYMKTYVLVLIRSILEICCEIQMSTPQHMCLWRNKTNIRVQLFKTNNVVS